MDMPLPDNKEQLLAAIESEHAALVQQLQGLTAAQMNDEIVIDEMSVKDLLAHVTFWEQYLLDRLHAAAQGIHLPHLINGDEDLVRVNAEVYAKNHERAVADVTADFDRTYDEVLHAVMHLSEEDIFDRARGLAIVGDDEESAFDHICAETIGHYSEHAEQIREWRSRL